MLSLTGSSDVEVELPQFAHATSDVNIASIVPTQNHIVNINYKIKKLQNHTSKLVPQNSISTSPPLPSFRLFNISLPKT